MYIYYDIYTYDDLFHAERVQKYNTCVGIRCAPKRLFCSQVQVIIIRLTCRRKGFFCRVVFCFAAPSLSLSRVRVIFARTYFYCRATPSGALYIGTALFFFQSHRFPGEGGWFYYDIIFIIIQQLRAGSTHIRRITIFVYAYSHTAADLVVCPAESIF